MTEAWHRLFAHPAALTLLWLLPLLAVGRYLAERRRRRLLGFLGNSAAIRSLTTPGSRYAWLWDILANMGLTLLIVGIAGPQWGRDETVEAVPGRDIMLVLDLSRSMLAEDVLPNRAGRAKLAYVDLIDHVGRRGGHRLGLVVFAAGAKIVCPLTHDYDHLRAALIAIDPTRPPPAAVHVDPEPVSGTRIGAGLRSAVGAHDQEAKGYQDIIIISDGDDPARDDEWQTGARAALERGIPVHAIGVGNPDVDSTIPGKDGKPLLFEGQVVATRLQEEPLMLLARSTGGVYVGARTDSLPLGKAFHEHLASAPTRELRDHLLSGYVQRYPWFFLAAFVMTALNVALRGWRFRPAGPSWKRIKPALGIAAMLMALLLLGAAPTDTANDLVRAGNAALDRTRPEAALDVYRRAEDLTDDPGLVAYNEAVAFYRLDRFRDAEAHFLRAREDATGNRLANVLLGLGNALVRQAGDVDASRLRQAIACYEKTLGISDLDSDRIAAAEHNLELARLLLIAARSKKNAKGGAASESNGPENDGSRSEAAQADDRDPRSSARAPYEGEAAGDMEGASAAEKNRPTPGQGNLPPIPDSDDLSPLNSDDAKSFLRQQADRILHENLEHRQASVPIASKNVKDW
jgi:Ca-activated chloride channel family protein